MNHLSKPTALNCMSFDLPVSQCENNCFYGKQNLCYALPKNNIHETYLKRKNKLQNNLEFLNSDNFVNEFSIELKINCISHFRFFSSGDISTIDQFLKIIQVCEILPKIKFWLPTHRQDILLEYFDKLNLKKPKNVNILYSLPMINYDIPKFIKQWSKKHKIGLSNVSTDKRKVNCQKSLNHGKCGSCFDCFSKKNIVYFLHGKRAIRFFNKR